MDSKIQSEQAFDWSNIGVFSHSDILGIRILSHL
jgi:hypothetical protein